MFSKQRMSLPRRTDKNGRRWIPFEMRKNVTPIPNGLQSPNARNLFVVLDQGEDVEAGEFGAAFQKS